jgi:prepilin-type N-terminal cleavage/methylation domain-containing protein
MLNSKKNEMKLCFFGKKRGFTPTPILQKGKKFFHDKYLFICSSFNKQTSGRIGVSFANAKRGFTIIETLVVIAIGVLVFSLVMFSFKSLKETNSLKKNVTSAVAFLEEAKLFRWVEKILITFE